jgi:GNAT superfamily N-acetyltransferase
MGIFSALKYFWAKKDIAKPSSEQAVIIAPFQETHKKEVIRLISDNDFEVGNSLPTLGLVALYQNNVIGYIGASKTYGRNGLVTIVVVHKVARKMKVGISLMKAMAKLLKENGVERFEAWVEEDNVDAIVLYAKMKLEMRKVYLIEHYTDSVLRDIK